MFRRIFIIFVLLLFSLTAFASDFTVHKLPNGQTLIIQEVKTNPIVTIDTWIKTGSVNEDDSNNGVAHFLEHLFFKGTKLHPAGEFDRILESKGAIVNAATSKDFTHYYITLPAEYFNTAIELHSDMLTNPQIPRKELEKERKVVLEEISKDLNSPSKQVYENLNSLMYTTHPYKRRVIGSSEIISKISREEILEYFNKFYAPSNMVTIIIGDVDTNTVVQKVSETFNCEYKKPIKQTFKKEHQLSSQKRNISYTDSNSGYMMIGFRGVPISDSETYTLDVLAQILGGGKSSRLYRNIKEQKGLVYSISASNGSFRDDGILYVSSNFAPANADKIEKSVFSEIELMQKYGVTEEELEAAKKMIERDTFYSRESTSNISSELGYVMALTGNSDFYKNYLDNINKVTAKDVQSAAQKFLGLNRSAVSFVLPKSSEAKVSPTEQKHSAKKISESEGSAKYLLDNKATLILNKHENNDIIAMSVILKGGEFLENKIGEGTLAANVMLKGTKKYSSQELAQLMDENGIKIQPICDEDTFTINVQTTTSQIDLTLEILDEIFNNALYDDYEIEKKRTELIGKIRQKRDIPMNVALENFKTLIFENSVYSHSNKILEKYLPQVSRADVVSYYKRAFDSKNVIISVNGNVDENKLIQSFGNIFTDRKQPLFKYSNYQVTKLSAPLTVSQNIKDLQTAWLFVGWQTDGVSNLKDFATLKVINTILGSGMSSRIFRNLREEEGLAYQLGSAFSPKRLGGSFVAFIGTNPKTLDYSRTKLINEIEKLKKEFVSDTELNDAKSRLKGGFVIAMETNAEKASITGQFEAVDLGYDFLNKYTKMVDEVTASDIIRVSNKYFNNIRVESSVR